MVWAWTESGNAEQDSGCIEGFCLCGNLGGDGRCVCALSDHGVRKLFLYDHECCNAA